MPHYRKDEGELAQLAKILLEKYESHKPTPDAGVKIDFLWAYGDRDDNGMLVNDAIRKGGVRALGLCKVVSLVDRAAGMGDVRILIDADWWKGDATPAEQDALLDHELHHIMLSGRTVDGVFHPTTDDLMRPKVKLRKHTYEFGWFDIIAQRHGKSAQEVQQARQMMEGSGQLYWPDLFPEKISDDQTTITFLHGENKPVTISTSQFSRLADEMTHHSGATIKS